MKKTVCPVDHHKVLTSSNLALWLNWQRVGIEDYTSGKSFETRRCPSCHGEFKRQAFISAVVYPVEVVLLHSPTEGQDRDLLVAPDWPADPKEFGRVLRRRRESAGLSRGELASICGVAVTTILNIEHDRHRPNQSIIARLTSVSQLQEIAAMESAVEVPAPPLRVEVKPKTPSTS